MTNPPLIWIVVLNWNGLEDTLACLDSLREVDYSNYRTVVVDNGSTDGSVDALRAMAADDSIYVIETGSNLGYAGGNNVGIRYALDRNAEFILLLNNDTAVDPQLLTELVAAARRHPGAGCFGPWIFYMHEPDRLWFTRSEWVSSKCAFSAPGKGRLYSELSPEATSTDYVCGAAMFFRAEVARKIGLLDERFFLVYEESDWCFRARRAGFSCLTIPTARVWHKVASSFGTEASPLRTYFSTRNHLLWAEKNVSRSELIRMFRSALHRALPALRIDTGAGVAWHKALFWGGRGLASDLSRKLRDPVQMAHRRAMLDYVLRRFGDCPDEVRALTQRWTEGEGTRMLPGRNGSG